MYRNLASHSLDYARLTRLGTNFFFFFTSTQFYRPLAGTPFKVKALYGLGMLLLQFNFYTYARVLVDSIII